MIRRIEQRHFALPALLVLACASLVAGCAGGDPLEPGGSPGLWQGEDYGFRTFPPDSTRAVPLPPPKTGVILSARADVLDLKLQVKALADPAWSGAGAGNPEFVDPAAELLRTARQFVQRRNWGAAAGAFRVVTEMNPDFLPAWEQLGNAYVELGDLDAGLDAFRKAVALEPRYSFGHVNLGQIYEQQGKLDQAEAAYGRAIDAAPEYPIHYVALSRLLVRRDRLAEASGVFDRALSILPDHPDLLAAQAEIQRRLGDPGMADSLSRRADAARRSRGR